VQYFAAVEPQQRLAPHLHAAIREALLSAGMVGPDIERMAADVLAVDGLPRYVWTGRHVSTRSATHRRFWRRLWSVSGGGSSTKRLRLWMTAQQLIVEILHLFRRLVVFLLPFPRPPPIAVMLGRRKARQG